MAEMHIICKDCEEEFHWNYNDKRFKYCPYCASSNLEIEIDESYGL